MSSTFDFLERFRDPVAFLSEPMVRDLIETEIFSVKHQSEAELRESILVDILSATMWERQSGQKLSFDMEELLRFVSDRQYRVKIREMIKHEEIADLIVETDGQLRIRDDMESLQAAMDYCGCWYSGFEMADGSICIRNDILESRMEEMGGEDNFFNSLVQDLMATHTTTDKVVYH